MAQNLIRQRRKTPMEVIRSISEAEAYREAGRFVAAFLCDSDCRLPENRAVAATAGLIAQERAKPSSVRKADYEAVAMVYGRGDPARDEEATRRLTTRAEEIVCGYWTTICLLAERILSKRGRFNAADLARFLARTLPRRGYRPPHPQTGHNEGP